MGKEEEPVARKASRCRQGQANTAGFRAAESSLLCADFEPAESPCRSTLKGGEGKSFQGVRDS